MTVSASSSPGDVGESTVVKSAADEARPTRTAAASGTKHLGRIDALRAIAILLVFFSHGATVVLPGSKPELLGVGGVTLFFVISGFCIHLSATGSLRRGLSPSAFLADYAGRRFWRIYPPYVAALIVFWLLDRRSPPQWHFWSHLLLIHNWSGATILSVNDSFWSIAVEWQFYALYPLLLLVLKRFGMKTLLIGVGLVAAASWGIGFWLQDWSAELRPELWASTLFMLFDWVLGLWLAEAWMAGRSIRGLETAAIIALILIVPAAMSKVTFTLCSTLSSIAAAGVLSWSLRSRKEFSGVEKLLVPVGLCSYSLYLWHQPLIGRVLSVCGKLGLPKAPPWRVAELVLIVLPVLVGLSWLSYSLIERPAAAMGRRK